MPQVVIKTAETTPPKQAVTPSCLPQLGERLQQQGLINAQDLQRALEFQNRFGGRLGAVLVRIGAISEDALLRVLSEELGLPVLQGAQLPFDAQPLLAAIEDSQIAVDWWLDQEVIAWKQDEQILCVARDPMADNVQEIIAFYFAEPAPQWLLARNQDVDRLIDLLEKAGEHQSSGNEVGHLRELAEGAPVVEFVNNMLSQAIDQRASDVHIEPEEKIFYVRYRTDGVLTEHLNLPSERFAAIASRIKLIAGLDIAERRLPQDGRLNTRVSGEELDIRVSTLPGVHGESIVMRLLPKERGTTQLEQLGMLEDHYQQFKQWVNEPHGIILVTGPTGSGKSTTLYATIDAINDRSRKIITVEDPVEYQLPHITQVQAHSDIGYTFAKALRSILRQDPDIVMIGEIRDLETAEIAVQASLTGHMVLSTLHTNDALSAFTRLMDMGVEGFMVATSVRAVQAQRLVRTLCTHCAQPTQVLPEIIEHCQAILPSALKDSPQNWRHAVGCPECQGSGYHGRLGIYEIVYMTPELQQKILQGASIQELRDLASTQGYRNLREDGWLKAWQGLTSVEEVLRVTESH
ncbi:GspE/PulE family protein [Candidatus Venteria ishoeyi]|uniref:Type II secretion system protein E n=1 Tax=Candidatus Venteria ishoeyi TaxID=1899563 RepID=A0A1H6F2I5_9GAMM|nr:type II/IV secretion system protein [Candidatus Venteria ishoeyi]MDM8546213.1 ATPase, T2SS/T4P/T4SS family [Candidatus Venteria ishoeyi]SEH04367.1 Type II secretion system protein E [Candidatus Venteria ishoeyi]